MIHHIHVGKCAGGSINKALFKQGIAFKEYHCGSANKDIEQLIRNDTEENIYLISTRDPIKRFISSFNWDKYEKIVLQNTTNPTWAKIYDTFSSVNHLVESLESSNDELKSMAECAFSGSFLHMHLGISWYLTLDLVSQIPSGRLYLIRTENLVDDFNHFLTGAFTDKSHVDSLPNDKDSGEFLGKINIENPKYLSENARRILRQKLNMDYKINSKLNELIEKRKLAKIL